MPESHLLGLMGHQFTSMFGGAKPADTIRSLEIAKGRMPITVGSVDWLPAADWHPDTVVTQAMLERRVRLVLLVARQPRTGALKRLVAAIAFAGLEPAVIAPSSDLEAILRRWGWTQTQADGERLWHP